MSAAAVVTLRQAENLVGLAYVPGRFDCVHLAVLAQYRLWGRWVAEKLPAQHPVRTHSQAAAVLQWRGQLAVPVDQPVSGDMVLFFNADEDGGAGDWHVGTLIVEGGEEWVLHTHQGLASSVLERLSDCRRRCLRVEGFYRWMECV